jgi:hypothetical protein
MRLGKKMRKVMRLGDETGEENEESEETGR